jgi:hypothetical protein
LSSEAFLLSILDILYSKAWQLRSLRAWNISDSALLTILLRLVDPFAPALVEVSIKGNPTLEQAFCRADGRLEVPFLINDCVLNLFSLENRLLQHTNGHYAFGLALQLRSLRSWTLLREDDLYRLRPAGAVVPLLLSDEDL